MREDSATPDAAIDDEPDAQLLPLLMGKIVAAEPDP